MQLPKVKFVQDIEAVKESLNYLLSSDSFADEVIQNLSENHPKIHKLLKESPKESYKKAISEGIGEFFEKNKTELSEALERTIKVWEPIEEQVGIALAKQFDTNWEGISDITAIVGMTEMCPRDIDKLNFQFYYMQYPFQTLATILHEITHFIYFKKWAELFPEDKEETREAPHSYWHLSEILVSVFNNDDSIKKLIPDAETRGYSEYRNRPYDSKIMDMSLQGYFEKKYLEYKADDKSIEDFLKFCRSEVDKIKFD